MTTPKAAHKDEYGGQQTKKKKDIEWNESFQTHNKNSQSLQQPSQVQKYIPPLNELQHHVHE